MDEQEKKRQSRSKEAHNGPHQYANPTKKRERSAVLERMDRVEKGRRLLAESHGTGLLTDGDPTVC